MNARFDSRFAALAVVAIVAGCSILPAASPALVLPAHLGHHELPVVLEDPDGLVQSVEPGPDDTSGADAISQVDADTAVLTWLGGECDAQAHLRISTHEGAIVAHVATEEPVGLGCTAAGVPRAVSITFRDPIGDRALTLLPAT